MSPTVNQMSKLFMVVFYLTALASLFVSSLAEYAQILLYITVALAIAHIGEYLLLSKRIKQLPGGQSGHFVGTLLFGFVYWLPLFKEHKV